MPGRALTIQVEAPGTGVVEHCHASMVTPASAVTERAVFGCAFLTLSHVHHLLSDSRNTLKLLTEKIKLCLTQLASLLPRNLLE